MSEWPRNWPELIRGIGCEMCQAGRPDADRYGIRIYEGNYSDAYLQRADVQRGYTLVIWRGRHVNEPTELDEAEAAGYWAEVLAVARALIAMYEPLKMNYETLGNSLPHLHTHLVPRYTADPRPASRSRCRPSCRRGKFRKNGCWPSPLSCGHCCGKEFVATR